MKECCATCSKRLAIEKLDYSQGGCKHTRIDDDFICLALSSEGVASYMIGINEYEGHCEEYKASSKPPLHWNEKRSWRDDPITEKQKQMIESIEENAGINGAIISKFIGTTKGEASDWISENIGKQCYSAYCEHEDAGDRI